MDALTELSDEAADQGSSWLEEHGSLRVVTRSLAAIQRLAPPGSVYISQAETIMSGNRPRDFRVRSLGAIVEALRDDYAFGAMQTMEELIHADLLTIFSTPQRNSSSRDLSGLQQCSPAQS